MKHVQRSLQAIIFFLFLAVGLWIGNLVGTGQHDEPNPTQWLTPEAPRSLVIMGVEDVTSSGTPLYSIWVVSYSLKTSQVYWLPVYPPKPGTGKNARYQEAHETIMIDALDLEGLDSLKLLEDISRDGIILLDELALTSLMVENLRIEPGFHMGAVIAPWNDPHAAYYQQTMWLELMCNDYTPLMAATGINTLLELFDQHVHSDLNYFELLAEYDRLDASGLEKFQCVSSW